MVIAIYFSRKCLTWIWQGNAICDYYCCCCYCQINYDIAALALRKKKIGNERECMIIMRGKRESVAARTHSAPPAWAAGRRFASVPYARSPFSPDSLVYVIW